AHRRQLREDQGPGAEDPVPAQGLSRRSVIIPIPCRGRPVRGCHVLQESSMRSRAFGRTGRDVGEIGFGAWAIGAAWGTVDDSESVAALHAALDAGVDFIDTADVYGDGHSERLI